MRQNKSSLPSCRKCKIRLILCVIQGEFQEVESNCSGRLSYVSSQFAMIPSSRSTLSRDNSLPHDTWNASGLQENVFGNQFSTLDSPRNQYQKIHHSMTPGDTSSVPVHIGTKNSFRKGWRFKKGTIPMLTFAGRPSTLSSLIPVKFPQNSMVGQQRQQISILQFDKFPDPQLFLVWKYDSKIKWPLVRIFPSDAMLWIKEVEMVDSLEELKSSRSASGKNFSYFEMLDAKIASVSNKSIQNSQFKKKDRLEEQKAQKEDWFLRGRQIAFMINDYFRVTGAHDTVLVYADLFSLSSWW